ncbi:MAG: hypothetical protein R3F17_06370 [Planctomycetota bacterium]
MNARTLLLCAAALGCAPSALAQQFQMQLGGASNSVSLTGGYSIDVTGNLLGDYDATTNPGGTQTRPGAFGGSGNQPIPLDLTLNGTVNDLAAPTGTFGLHIDRVSGLAEVTWLSVQATGGGMFATDLSADLLFSTFHTVAPDSIFFGGVPITLPLGQQTISNLNLTPRTESPWGS